MTLLYGISFDMSSAAICHIRCHVTSCHQELAVEDMRHELDDEGRREFFEEQGEDGDGGAGGRYGVWRGVVSCQIDNLA